MSRLFLFLVIVIFCFKTNTEYLNQDSNMIVNTSRLSVSYEDWYKSVLNSIDDELLIHSFQKENLKVILNNINEEEFGLLIKEIKNKSIEPNSVRLVLYFSENEVVTNRLIFFYLNNEKKLYKTYLEIEFGRISFIPSIEVAKCDFKSFDVKYFSSENEYQGIVIITSIQEDSLITKIGNPNDYLVKAITL